MLPQNVQPGLLAQIDRHATGLLALALLVAMPLVLLALTPWLESSPNGAQWDRRTGIVGRPARN